MKTTIATVIEEFVAVTLYDPDIEIQRIDRRLAEHAHRNDLRTVHFDQPRKRHAHRRAEEKHGRVVKTEYEQELADHRSNIRIKNGEAGLLRILERIKLHTAVRIGPPHERRCAGSPGGPAPCRRHTGRTDAARPL